MNTGVGVLRGVRRLMKFRDLLFKWLAQVVCEK